MAEWREISTRVVEEKRDKERHEAFETEEMGVNLRNVQHGINSLLPARDRGQQTPRRSEPASGYKCAANHDVCTLITDAKC